MPTYRIVKWSSVLPARRMPATDEVFTNLALAETVKERFQRILPYRCFAVEEFEADSDIQDGASDIRD